MNLTVLYYKKCSTCQKTLKWLDANGTSYMEKPIREENPTLGELKEWYENSGLFLKRFFNINGNIYKKMSLKDKLPSMSEGEQLALLITDGVLVKRSLVVGDGFVLTGFKEAEWREKLLQILTRSHNQPNMKRRETHPTKSASFRHFFMILIVP